MKTEVLRGRYQIVSSLGSGGFSDVWRATDLQTGSDVAVKLARAGREAEANEKLRDEAAILGGLDHPNIVRVLDSGSDEGREFIVMELLDGKTLRDQIRESGPMTDEQVSMLGLALADALTEAHAHGLVHGDVKPENVIITDGVPRLIDFGTARDLSDTLLPAEVRQIAGTLAYLAPELLLGEPLTPQSDVYSLGVTLYEARAGRLPFAGAGGLLAGSEGRRALPLRTAVPGVDPRLESAIMQSLAVDPAWRPGSAQEVHERLSSGRHATIVLRPQRGSAAKPGSRPHRESAAPAGVAAAATMTRGPAADFQQSSRRPFIPYEEWLEQQDRRHRAPRRVLAALAGLVLLGAGAFGAMSLLSGDSGDGIETAARDEPESPAVVAIETETLTATPPASATSTPVPSATATVTATTVPPTATSPATSVLPTATPPPPTATPPPPTPTPPPPAPQPDQEAQLTSNSGATTVLRWYDLLVNGEFDAAYALWSDRMKANFPRQGNLDGRWANTVNVTVNDVRVLSQSGNRMTVAIDFVETQASGSTTRYSGSWLLVASGNGWLLDQPNF